MRDTEKPSTRASTSARRPDEAFTSQEWQAASTLQQELDYTRAMRDKGFAEQRHRLQVERTEHAAVISRIAAILATFYHAELSMSSVQPLLALALELNPDLVERAR